MSRHAWDQDDKDQYEEFMRSVVADASTTEDRVDLIEDRIVAEKASGAFWPEEVLREARRNGLRTEITKFIKRQRVLFAVGTRVVEKPKTIAVTRIDHMGKRVTVQAMFELLPWDEISQKRTAYLVAERVYSDNVALMDRLLALRVLAPDAATPGDACRVLGLSIDEFLSPAA